MLALKEKCRISDNELDEAKKKLISAECSLNDMSRTGIALDQNEVVQVMVIIGFLRIRSAQVPLAQMIPSLILTFYKLQSCLISSFSTSTLSLSYNHL